METLGYQAMGEYGIPLRRYFQKGLKLRTHNVHIFEQNNPEIDRHIMFRDWMRAHPEDAKAYADLKKNLAARFPEDIFSYCTGKEDFIALMDEKAGWRGLRFVHALMSKEWKAVEYFRGEYFSGLKRMEDPCQWTFNHSEHAHLILYQGIKVIGYAHIQFWKEARAAMRIIVIDEKNRNMNVGSQFLALIERWLKASGIKSIHAESSQSVLSFFLKNGYFALPLDDPENHVSKPENIAVGKWL